MTIKTTANIPRACKLSEYKINVKSTLNPPLLPRMRHHISQHPDGGFYVDSTCKFHVAATAKVISGYTVSIPRSFQQTL